MSSRASRVHHALRNPLVVEVGDLLAKMKILEKRRPAVARLERMVGVGKAQTLAGGEEITALGAGLIARATGGAYWKRGTLIGVG